MREIDLYEHENKDRLPVDTILVYGETRSGKTTFSGGAPRPLVLADESEGGWRSLQGLSDEQLFEPDVNPIVWGISQMNDISTALDRIPPLIATGRVKTVVISSITFYAQTYLAHLLRVNPNADTRQVYGNLGIHLREIRTRFHDLGVSVIWEALADPPESGGEGKESHPGRPLIAGKSAHTFGAGVTYLWRSILDEVKEGGKIRRVLKLQTQSSGGYLCGVRAGMMLPQLPNPMLGGYAGFLAARGYDLDRLRKSLPPIKATSVAVSAPKSAPKVASPPSGAKATTTTVSK